MTRYHSPHKPAVSVPRFNFITVAASSCSTTSHIHNPHAPARTIPDTENPPHDKGATTAAEACAEARGPRGAPYLCGEPPETRRKRERRRELRCQRSPCWTPASEWQQQQQQQLHLRLRRDSSQEGRGESRGEMGGGGRTPHPLPARSRVMHGSNKL